MILKVPIFHAIFFLSWQSFGSESIQSVFMLLLHRQRVKVSAKTSYRALRKHFKDYDAILNLLLGGFISIISNGYVKHYANRQSMKWEDSREYEGCKPIQGSLDELRKSIYGQFEYIFEDGKWKSYDGLTHKPL
jgi:hypothetical protein